MTADVPLKIISIPNGTNGVCPRQLWYSEAIYSMVRENSVMLKDVNHLLFVNHEAHQVLKGMTLAHVRRRGVLIL